jgi:hypothetical protein
VIDDALLEEGVRHPLDHATDDLTLGGEAVHRNAAVLEGDHSLHPDRAGFRVGQDLGELATGDPVGELLVAGRARDPLRDGVGEVPAQPLPGEALARSPADDGGAPLEDDVGRRNPHRLGRDLDEALPDAPRGDARGRREAGRRRGPARGGTLGEPGVADADGHVRRFEPELLGDEEGEERPQAAADVLGPGPDLDRAVAADLDLDRHPGPAGLVPDRRSQAEAALPGRVHLPARVAVLPPEAVGAELELGVADGVGGVAKAHLERVDPELGSELVEDRLQGEGPLRVPGCAKGARRPEVGEDVGVLEEQVGHVVDVARRSGRARAAADAAGAVGDHVEGGELALAGGASAHALDGVGAVAGAEVLLLAVEHDPDRRPGFAGEAGGDDHVQGHRELGAETGAHVVAEDPDLLR